MKIMPTKDCPEYIEEKFGLSMSLSTFYRRHFRNLPKYRVSGGAGISDRDLDEYIESTRS